MTFRGLVYAFVASVVGLPMAAQAGAPTYQGALQANIVAPRRLAASSTGEMFVADAQGRLYFLTRRGGARGVVLSGVAAVTTGPGAVYAVTLDSSLVQLDPQTGRAVRRTDLGASEVPSALAHDAAQDKLWIVFPSGTIQVRRPDGTRVHDIVPATDGSNCRLSGVTVDGAGLVWVMQDRTGTGGTMHAYDAASGAWVKAVAVNQIQFTGGFSASSGNVYVTDLFSGKVELVGPTGASVQTLGGRGTTPGLLSQPAGVGLMANGDVVVANMDAGRLERYGSGAALPTCPGDSDCDGIPDDWEIANGLDPNEPSDSLLDLDRDGLSNIEEYLRGTNPRLADSDADGYSDGEEVASGFDPLNGNDHRPQIVAASPGAVEPGYVRLSASVHDPVSDRGACTLRWAQSAGTPVVLSGAATAAPAFVARAAGDYGFQVAADCGGVSAVPADVTVTVSNVAPRADGGRTTVLAAGGALALSGAFSRDGNGDALSFTWDQVSGPASSVTASGAALSGTLAQPGLYVFRLGATDAAGATATADVPVVVVGATAAPSAAVASPVLGTVGAPVTLDASASAGGASASFAWLQVEGPAVALDAAGASATFTPPAAGKYAFTVAVTEGGLASPPARAEVFVAADATARPVAVATAPASAKVGAPVVLDGSASTGSGLAYQWRQVSGPAAGLSRADRAAATAVLFEAGSCEFELSVTDGAAVSAPARVRVEGRANGKPIPVAVATSAAQAAVGETVLLDGRASVGAVSYRWTQVGGPLVPVAQGAIGSFKAVAAGTYAFELEVDDGTVRSAPVRVSVVVLP